MQLCDIIANDENNNESRESVRKLSEGKQSYGKKWAKCIHIGADTHILAAYAHVHIGTQKFCKQADRKTRAHMYTSRETDMCTHAHKQTDRYVHKRTHIKQRRTNRKACGSAQQSADFDR